MQPRIGVVIPYFQREAGLLQRALSSVSTQEYGPVQVVVVDDGSPRPAEEEITPTLRSALPGLTLVRQTNQGVAAARNAALDALMEDVSAIAFLDADDYWQPSHLRNAAAALAQGADFFFANYRFEGVATDRFEEHRRRNAHSVQDIKGVARWSGSVSELMAIDSPLATPAVVFRRAVMPEVRFPVTFRRAGEDHVAWWDLLLRSSVIMYSTEPTVVVGMGGLGTRRNSGYGSIDHLVRLADEIRIRQHVLSNYPVSASEQREVHHQIAVRREAALYSALHLLRHKREKAVVNEILYLLRSDPRCAAFWCLAFPKLTYRKIRDTLVTRRQH